MASGSHSVGSVVSNLKLANVFVEEKSTKSTVLCRLDDS